MILIACKLNILLYNRLSWKLFFVVTGKDDRETFEKASRVTRKQMQDASTTGLEVEEKTVKVRW